VALLFFKLPLKNRFENSRNSLRTSCDHYTVQGAHYYTEQSVLSFSFVITATLA